MPHTDKLRFIAGGNAKIPKHIHTFSLPAGHTCPQAHACLAKADRETGKITDGPFQTFRCFAATAESVHSSVRKSRWRNFELVRDALKQSPAVLTFLILRSIPKAARIIRVHVSGDFFSQAYVDAWLAAIAARPDIRFYAYTKSMGFFLSRKLPPNFSLTYSFGGRATPDSRATSTARVVFSEDEARELELEIDHDESHALAADKPFALLIHSTQRKGSAAAAALKANGWKGYGNVRR